MAGSLVTALLETDTSGSADTEQDDPLIDADTDGDGQISDKELAAYQTARAQTCARASSARGADAAGAYTQARSTIG